MNYSVNVKNLQKNKKSFDSTVLQKALDQLAEWEKKITSIEQEIEIYKNEKTSDTYKERNEILQNIEKFWYIVLAQNEEFAEYIEVDDMIYIEDIKSINLTHEFKKKNGGPYYTKFTTLSIHFQENQNKKLDDQILVKHFESIIKNGEERLISNPVNVKWPKTIDHLNPLKILKNSNYSSITQEEKSNLRQGQKSFFSWFHWTGKKKNEFPDGEGLSRLIIDEIYPNATRYYALALNDSSNDSSSDLDSSEGESIKSSGQ